MAAKLIGVERKWGPKSIEGAKFGQIVHHGGGTGIEHGICIHFTLIDLLIAPARRKGASAERELARMSVLHRGRLGGANACQQMAHAAGEIAPARKRPRRERAVIGAKRINSRRPVTTHVGPT